MNYLLNLDLLLCEVNSIFNIAEWLENNEAYFELLISESNCRKWSKWLEDKSTHIFPCCCSLREQDCIFIEAYYKLGKIVELYQKEEYFNSLVSEYKLIADNKNAVLDWFKKYQSIGSYIGFSSELHIMLEIEPYRSLKIKLNENEFKNIIEFQNIFYEIE